MHFYCMLCLIKEYMMINKIQSNDIAYNAFLLYVMPYKGVHDD